jgi:Mitochondrial carrier protein
MKKVVGDEGVYALWKGVNAAWLREASYTSLRLGLYEPVKIAFGAHDPASSTFMKKFLAGSAAGALGSLAGNPFDVLKTKVRYLLGVCICHCRHDREKAHLFCFLSFRPSASCHCR